MRKGRRSINYPFAPSRRYPAPPRIHGERAAWTTGGPPAPTPPYHLAVFQVYVRGAADPEPILNSERGWSKDYISMTEPFEMRHEPGDVGKTAYYRAHWETSGGVKGPWAMSSAEVP